MRTVTAVSVHHDGKSPIYDESVFIVSIEDEGSGFFVSIRQCLDEEQKIKIDIDELREVYEAAKWLLKQAEVKE